MNLKETIQADLVVAMKAKNELAVSTLRMVHAAIKNAEIAGERKALTDDQVMQIVKREIKQRQDANGDFEKGGRADLVEQNKKEIEVLKKYLPAMMSESEVVALVDKVIAELKPVPSDFGKVMKAVMAASGGKADGELVSKLVRERLK